MLLGYYGLCWPLYYAGLYFGLGCWYFLLGCWKVLLVFFFVIGWILTALYEGGGNVPPMFSETALYRVSFKEVPPGSQISFSFKLNVKSDSHFLFVITCALILGIPCFQTQIQFFWTSNRARRAQMGVKREPWH